jgi:hypothetical protein
MTYDDNDMPSWQQPFFQAALPTIISFGLATQYQSSRIIDLRDILASASTTPRVLEHWPGLSFADAQCLPIRKGSALLITVGTFGW